MARALAIVGLCLIAGLAAGGIAARFLGRWAWAGLLLCAVAAGYFVWRWFTAPTDNWQALGAIVSLLFMVAPAALGWVAGVAFGLRWRRRALSG